MGVKVSLVSTHAVNATKGGKDMVLAVILKALVSVWRRKRVLLRERGRIETRPLQEGLSTRVVKLVDPLVRRSEFLWMGLDGSIHLPAFRHSSQSMDTDGLAVSVVDPSVILVDLDIAAAVVDPVLAAWLAKPPGPKSSWVWRHCTKFSRPNSSAKYYKCAVTLPNGTEAVAGRPRRVPGQLLPSPLRRR